MATMTAVVTTGYGGSEVLQVEETERPMCGPGEVLVRVRACSVNPVDWKVRRGEAKLLSGLRPPLILGGDFAGTVAAVGSDVSDFREDQDVWGLVSAFKGGAYAQYIAVKPSELAPKPSTLNFEEAASLPLVAMTAFQSLVQKCGIASGQHVMVNGCSGGVGLSAIQIAKAHGCTVTGACSEKNRAVAEEYGADAVLNYRETSVVSARGAYDVFMDAVASESFAKARPTLTAKGQYVSMDPILSVMLFGPALNAVRRKKSHVLIVSPGNQAGFRALGAMAEKGALRACVEKVFPLDQVRDAHAMSEAGRVVGKLVLSVP